MRTEIPASARKRYSPAGTWRDERRRPPAPRSYRPFERFTFDVPSAALRVVDRQAKIRAEIDLVDPASGALVLRYDGPSHVRALVEGLATGLALILDRSDRGHAQITDYMTADRNWLLRK